MNAAIYWSAQCTNGAYGGYEVKNEVPHGGTRIVASRNEGTGCDVKPILNPYLMQQLSNSTSNGTLLNNSSSGISTCTPTVTNPYYAPSTLMFPSSIAATTRTQNTPQLPSAAAIMTPQPPPTQNYGWFQNMANQTAANDIGRLFSNSVAQQQQNRVFPPPCGAGTNHFRIRTKEKYRTVYTEPIKFELEKEFCFNHFINSQRKTELSEHLGLTERQVKIWFQNRRAKERKQKRKSTDQESPPSNNECSEREADIIVAAKKRTPPSPALGDVKPPSIPSNTPFPYFAAFQQAQMHPSVGHNAQAHTHIHNCWPTQPHFGGPSQFCVW